MSNSLLLFNLSVHGNSRRDSMWSMHRLSMVYRIPFKDDDFVSDLWHSPLKRVPRMEFGVNSTMYGIWKMPGLCSRRRPNI